MCISSVCQLLENIFWIKPQVFLVQIQPIQTTIDIYDILKTIGAKLNVSEKKVSLGLARVLYDLRVSAGSSRSPQGFLLTSWVASSSWSVYRSQTEFADLQNTSCKHIISNQHLWVLCNWGISFSKFIWFRTVTRARFFALPNGAIRADTCPRVTQGRHFWIQSETWKTKFQIVTVEW